MSDNSRFSRKWFEALDRAEADVLAGRVFYSSVIHDDIAASINRMTKDKSKGPQPVPASR